MKTHLLRFGLLIAFLLPVIANGNCKENERTASNDLCQANDNQNSKPEINSSFHFLNKKYNLIQYANKSDFSYFLEKWNTNPPEKITIAHFGDSHIQNGFLISAAREKLEAIKGKGGRGMIFPYAIAKTYSQNDYISSFTGAWLTANSMHYTPKVPVGISGFSAKTTDANASVAFNFTKSLDPGPKKITLFLHASPIDYQLKISAGEHQQTIKLESSAEKSLSYIEIIIPEIRDSLNLDFSKLFEEDGELTIYGVSIENTELGLTYHNLGVGGAAYNAINAQVHFTEQLALIHPDLVIVDYGTNDIIYKNSIPENHAATVIKTIEKIRASQPNVTILLTSTQDMNFKGRNISAAKDFSAQMKRLAFEQHCLFYDWYQVSGNQHSMKKWHAAQLSQTDNIHLNVKGYQLKGTLFADALLNTIELAKESERLILEDAAEDQNQEIQTSELAKKKNSKNKMRSTKNKQSGAKHLKSAKLSKKTVNKKALKSKSKRPHKK
jgi:lysophospholipase L1-like esterase